MHKKYIFLIIVMNSTLNTADQSQKPLLSAAFLSIESNDPDADVMAAMETWLEQQNPKAVDSPLVFTDDDATRSSAVCSSLLVLSREPSVSPHHAYMVPIQFVEKLTPSCTIVCPKVKRDNVDAHAQTIGTTSKRSALVPIKSDLEACKADIRSLCWSCSACAALFLTQEQHNKHTRSIPHSCFDLQKNVLDDRIKNWSKRCWSE